MAKEELKPLILIVLLAFGLRLAGITFDSLWLDESYQSLVDAFGQRLPDFVNSPARVFLFAFGPPLGWTEVLANFKNVDPLCPPLYALLLNRWMLLAGQSDLALRGLSCLLSTLAVLVTYCFARCHLGRKAAVMAGLLQAVSPFDIYYGQEARMYSLSMLASVSSAWCLSVLLLRRFTWLWALGYVLTTWALINSHYTGLFVVAFQGIWSTALCCLRRDFKACVRLIILWLGILLLWWPWFDIFRQAAAIRTESFYVAREASWFWPIWALAVRIPFNWMSFLIGKKVTVLAAGGYVTSLLLLFSGVAALLPAGLKLKLASLVAGTKQEKQPLPVDDSKNSAILTFVVFWALLPALMIWFLDVVEGHRVIEISRYVLATSPAVYVFAGWGLSYWWQLGPWSWRLLMLHAVCALVNNTYAHLVPQREPWAQMADKVELYCPADELLLVCQYYNIVCLDRYLRFPRLQQGISSNFSVQQLESLLDGRKQFWLLTAQEGEAIKDRIPASFQLERQVDLHHALHLRHYRRF